MQYKIAAIWTALIAAFALAACKPGGADQGTVIRIGSAAPLTGEIAHLGKDNENGARMAVDDINAAGGVKLGDKTYRLELGWLPPIDIAPFNWIPGPVWFAAKVALVLFFFLWVRATFPRYRYDQLMRLGWKVFLPLSLLWVVVTAGALMAFGWLP